MPSQPWSSPSTQQKRKSWVLQAEQLEAHGLQAAGFEMAPIQSQEPFSVSTRSSPGNLKPQGSLLPGTHLKDAPATQQSVQESLSSALNSTFPALNAQHPRSPKKDAKASRQAIMDLLHPEQPPPLVNTHFAPEGRPYTGAAAVSPPAAAAAEIRLRPVVKPSQGRSPPEPSYLPPADVQPSSDEVQPIIGQAIQLGDDSPPLEEGTRDSNQAWFRSSGARPDLQAATSVGPSWDSPESLQNPRGVSGRIPVAPLPAMSFPAPLRMGSKPLAAADLEDASRADQGAAQAPMSLQKSMEVLARLRAPAGAALGRDTALWLQLTASGATANADDPLGQTAPFPTSADAQHTAAAQRAKAEAPAAEVIQPPRTPKRSESPTKGSKAGREPSLDGTWLQNLMEHEMAMLDEATLAAKEALHAHGIQRHALPLRLPLNARCFADRLAVCIRDSAGVPTLLALPSDRPSLRQEAVAVELLLTEAIAQPPHSLELAAAWRAHSLLEFCNTSMTALSARGIPQASHAWATSPSSMPDLPTNSANARPAAASSPSALTLRQASRPQSEISLHRQQTLGGTGTGSHAASRTDPATNILTQSLRRPQRVAFDLISGAPGSPSHASVPPQPSSNHGIAHAAGSLAWDMHCVGCLAAAASVAMADLVRQVEVGCAQRGRSLALTWNLQTACTEAALSRAESITGAATDLQAHCEAQAMHLEMESKTSSALRREVTRRRQECDVQKADYVKLHDILEDKLVQLNTVKGELAQISAWSKKRMAKLRWQHAIATVTTLRAMGHQELPKPDPFAAEALSRNTSSLLSQMEATETLARDTAKVKRRKSIMVKAVEEFKHAQLEGSVDGRQSFNAVGKLSGAEMLSLATSGSEEQAAAMMSSLSPEARAMMLTSMDPHRRRRVLKTMKHEQNAAILVSMNHASRKSVLEDLEANGDVKLTMDVIRKRPQFTSKWIAGMTGKELEAEIAALTSEQMTALLTHLKPHLAAELLQELGPKLAAKPLQRLSVDNAGRVLSAMSPRAAVSNLMVADNPWAFNTLKGMKDTAAQAVFADVDIDSAAQLMNGLVERDRLVFMDMLPEDLREDVQKAFQLRQARKWGGNAPLEGLAALEAMPDPDQAAPFKNIGFSEKVRLLSAMSPAQVSAILGIYTKEDAANMIDAMAPGVRDAMMGSLMEPALHAVEAVARQATLGDKNDASVEEVLRAASEAIEQLNSFSRLASITAQGSLTDSSPTTPTHSHTAPRVPASPRAVVQDSPQDNSPFPGADEDPPDAMDVNPQAANEEASVPAPVAPASSSLPRRGSGPDLPGKAATGASRTPKGTRFADAGGEAGSAAARAKPASNPDAPGARLKRMARTQSSLASQLADLPGSLENTADESQPHAAPLRSQPSAMVMPGQSKPATKLSKRASMPSDVLHHMASEAEALTHASSLARQATLSSQGADFASSMSGLGPRSFTELVQRAKMAEVAKKGTGLSHKPKNQNLLEVMARNKGAKVRTTGWLLGVIEQLYTEVEVRQRKMGDSLAGAGKMNMPDITFAYFLQKYGRKNLVDEYVGSLVNTLERFREEDSRLATFEEFLSEHWEIGIVLGYLQACNLAQQAAVVSCIDYPARTSEPNAQPFICLRKASYIADAVLGLRNEKVKERFLQILKLSAVQATEADMQWFFASSETPKATTGKAAPKSNAQQSPKACDMYKVHRSKFLHLLCTELHRIEATITAALPGIWNSMQGEEGHPIAQTDILGLLSRSDKDLPDTARQNTSLDLVLEEFMKAATQTQDGSDAAAAHVSLDGFMTAAMACQVLRDSIRLREVKPALLPGEAEDADESPHSITLTVVVLRHFEAMLSAWLPLTLEPSPAAAKHQSEIQKLRGERGGVAKLKSYAAFLQSLMATCFQLMLSTMLESDTAPDQVEVRLCRAEDAVLVLMGNPYLVADPSTKGTSTGGLTSMDLARTRRLAPPFRVGGLAAQAAVWRQLKTSQEQMAALIVQHKWRLIVQDRKAKQMLSDVQRASISSLSPRHQGLEAQLGMSA